MIETKQRHAQIGSDLTWTPPGPESMFDPLGSSGLVHAVCSVRHEVLYALGPVASDEEALSVVTRQGWITTTHELSHEWREGEGDRYFEPWTQTITRLVCYGCRQEADA